MTVEEAIRAERPCKNCGRVMYNPRKNKKFCCEICRAEFNNQRKKEKKDERQA